MRVTPGMNLWRGIRNFFKWPFAGQRNYANMTATGGSNTDWPVSNMSQDADVWRNNPAYRARLRELFDQTAFFAKYQEALIANVYGDEGIRLRMKIKEESDRVVYTAGEKSLHEMQEERMDRLRDWVERKTSVQPLMRTLFDRAKATVKAGALDLFANQLIERKWKEWQRAEYATMSGKLTYGESRHLRMIAAARDGDFFIRLVRSYEKKDKNPVNKFGFSIQLINSEWCDFGLNRAKKEGINEIRMGVELNEWGKPVAYHFIKRSGSDWQQPPPANGGWQGTLREHVRIDASEIIHYARFKYADSTRPASWGVAAIPVARDLSQYVEAAVKAARAGACQMGFLVSKIVPEGGGLDPSQLPNPCDLVNDFITQPGLIKALPYGVEYQAHNPNNPNSQFSPFRKEGYRELAAIMPGANYNSLANDPEGISYSTGRIFSLEEREIWKVLQKFDIDKAERPIFEAWLEMALITGEIPLPLAKFEKFNKPQFSGRRWPWVDPAKDALALETELKNYLTSWSRIMDEKGQDLEEVWIERAEEMMLAEELGLKLPTWDAVPVDGNQDNQDSGDQPKPNGKQNGRHVSLAVN